MKSVCWVDPVLSGDPSDQVLALAERSPSLSRKMRHTNKSLYGACQKVRPRKKESGKVEMEDQEEKC